MQSNYGFFCDAATTDASGKLNVLGIFNSVNVVSFPGSLHRMFLVLSVETHRSEQGTHSARINLVDQDGSEVTPAIVHSFEIVAGQSEVKLIVEFNNLTFPKPGTYAADMTVDNHHIKSLALQVFGSRGGPPGPPK
jgi:hypothetical protein